jgi:putative hemolysin
MRQEDRKYKTFSKGSKIMIKEEDFTRINNDVNGNPRYVIHFLQCLPVRAKDRTKFSVSEAYAEAVYCMKKIGGKRFHNKQYGGGIVFQSYSVPSTIKDITDLLEKENAK